MLLKKIRSAKILKLLTPANKSGGLVFRGWGDASLELHPPIPAIAEHNA
ncbi:hypothetical protein SAMN05216311_101577 [Chitinophaga sp. CF418]|nr:hypothetical protein SAMN05216311_101577 [Chitinophaga sp. CF418]